MRKILLDECVPRKFKQHFAGHECVTVPELGLTGKKNGELLPLAEAAGFQVSSRVADLVPHAARILEALNGIGPGQLVRVP